MSIFLLTYRGTSRYVIRGLGMIPVPKNMFKNVKINKISTYLLRCQPYKINIYFTYQKFCYVGACATVKSDTMTGKLDT